MNGYIFSDASKNEIQLIEESKELNKFEYVMGRVGSPADKINSMESLIEYRQHLEKKAKDLARWTINYENKKKGIKPEDVIQEEISEQVIEVIMKSSDNSKYSENEIKFVYCYIESYVEDPATIKVERRDPSIPLSNIEVQAIYTKSYQWMYQEEEKEVGNPGHIEGMLNRERSNGRYGIYGHDLSDLVYNGDNFISVYNGFVYCQFEVDS